VLPFWWRIIVEPDEGGGEVFQKFWPFLHYTAIDDKDGTRIGGDWSLLSPWPWRNSNATGIEEVYGWLWQIAHGRQRASDDDSLDLAARLYTQRERAGDVTSSMPFLWNYESTASGGTTLRLFQFLPISFGGGAAAEAR
jgi:hypothetical protein